MRSLILEIHILLADYYLYSEKLREFKKLLRKKNSSSTLLWVESLFVDSKLKLNDLKKLLKYLETSPVSSFDRPLKKVPKIKTEVYSEMEIITAIHELQKVITNQSNIVLVLAKKEEFHALEKFTSGIIFQLKKNCTIRKTLRKAI